MSGTALAFMSDQAREGSQVFRLQCARCHGENGQGITDAYKGLTAPPLIGLGVFPLNPRPDENLRHFQFKTVQDVYEFASSVMPLDQPASLKTQDYWNVIAYLLDANGMRPDGQPLTQQSASKLSLATLRKRQAALSSAGKPLDQHPSVPGTSPGKTY